MNPILLVDFYKTEHYRMMPKGTSKIVSGLTPRKSRIPGVDHVVVFGIQYFIKKYLINEWTKKFFKKPLKKVLEQYSYAIHTTTDHIAALHKLGYLPIRIKALPEGTLCPIKVPILVIEETNSEFSWLTNYLETQMSTVLWQPMTSATIAHEYKKILTKYAQETGGDLNFIQWQGHDFSMRGMSSIESATVSGMGHLTSFTGTDTIPSIYALKKYYKGEGLIGASVPATEHSIQCMHYDYETGNEDQYFDHLINLYPTGIVSAVSDGFNLWDILTKTLPKFKDRIMARDGKFVIRPDSGDPVDIICGIEISKHDSIEDAQDYFGDELYGSQIHGEQSFSIPESKTVKVQDKYFELTARVEFNRYDKQYYFIEQPINFIVKPVEIKPEQKGVVELLWDLFGGSVNDKGYKVLDSHIGTIYGDSITTERAKNICERLKAKGFASTNIVFGIGSYTYQHNTRDTLGFAVKATYGEINGIGKEIFKDPITDDGTKKSAKGLLGVFKNEAGELYLKDQLNKYEYETGELQTVFQDGILIREFSLEEIRNKLNEYGTK